MSWTALILFAVAGVLAAMLIAAAFWERQRIAARQARALSAQRFLHAVLNASSQAWMAKEPGGAWIASRRLGEWLERAPSDAAALLSEKVPEIERLSPDSPPLDKVIDTADRRFQLTASVVPMNMGDISVVWLWEITDQTAEKTALIEESRRLNTAFLELEAMLDQAPFPVWRRDSAFQITWVNQAYITAVGAPDREAVIQDQIEPTAGAMAQAMQDEAHQALETGKPQTARHFVVMGDQRRAMHVYTVPLAQATGLVSYALDTTEVEELRGEIDRLIQAHKETLNTMTTAVAIFGPDKTLDYYNRAFARLWHMPEEWLDTCPHHADFLDALRDNRRLPEQVDFQSWKEARLAQYTDVIEPREEYWHLPDSRTLRVVVHPHPMGGLLVLYEDVTDRLAMERSYNTLIAVQRETLNKLFEAVAVFGSDGHLRLFNPAYAEIWDLDGEWLNTGPHVSPILEECQPLFADAAESERLHEVVLGGAEHREAAQGRLHRPDGRVIDYTAVPLPDGGTLLTYLDITDRFQIERALRERNEALETADRLKSEFIAHVSYELRTPLNSIIGFTDILGGEHFGPLNDKQREYVADISRSSEQLRALINDILDLSMIEAGAMALETEPIQVRAALEEVRGLAAEFAHQKGQTLRLSCPQNVGKVEADRKRLVQVIYNLVSNAIKYTPAGGEITLGARRKRDAVALYVADTGVGIAAQDQEKVFQKFQTGQEKTHQGAGLGLALVRSFVELHQGSVTLDSEPGKGTRVTCMIPVRQKAVPDAALSQGEAGMRQEETESGHASLSSPR